MGGLRTILLFPKANVYREKFLWDSITYRDKGKVDPVLFLTEHHAMKAYWGSGGTVPLIL
jgi:hypothetical protein